MASDGSFLNPILDASGRIVGLSGTGKDGLHRQFNVDSQNHYSGGNLPDLALSITTDNKSNISLLAQVESSSVLYSIEFNNPNSIVAQICSVTRTQKRGASTSTDARALPVSVLGVDFNETFLAFFGQAHAQRVTFFNPAVLAIKKADQTQLSSKPGPGIIVKAGIYALGAGLIALATGAGLPLIAVTAVITFDTDIVANIVGMAIDNPSPTSSPTPSPTPTTGSDAGAAPQPTTKPQGENTPTQSTPTEGDGTIYTGGPDDDGAEGCFVPGTLVATESGYVPIEKIEVGMQVVACDMETMQLMPRNVARCHRTARHEIVILDFGNEEIRCTLPHRFYVNSTWVAAGELRPGDCLLSRNGTACELRGFRRDTCPADVDVYNLTVREHHNYFVGNLGLLVHNMKIDDPDRPKLA